MKTTKKYGKRIDSALSLWVKLSRAHAVFNRLTNEQIRTFDLTTPQFGVIESLGHLGPMTIHELCEKQLVSAGNMTIVLDNLERGGMIERVHQKPDRRSITIHLTEKGKALFDSIFKAHAEYVSTLASVLTLEEQRQLSVLLKKLGTGLGNQTA